MGDSLFQGLPPPAAPPASQQQEQQQGKASKIDASDDKKPPAAPAPALKSALKRPKSPKINAFDGKDSPAVPTPAPKSALKRPKSPESHPQDTIPEKRLRFKMMKDASEVQVIDAMQKISSHIKNPGKFSKASKLAVQLIQAGSVKSGTADHFFEILEAAMSLPTSCTDATVRADYHTLFAAAQDTAECLNSKQKNQLSTWTMRTVVANDLFTDDSFVFSKATGRIKEAICNLPIATEEDDKEEAAVLEDETVAGDEDGKKLDASSAAAFRGTNNEESDPFGLDALIPSTLKKDEKTKGKKDMAARIKQEEEEAAKRFLKSQREALVTCLEIAARRYRVPWCQTGIDILVKHAYDNISRFTHQQRDAIGKLWASIKEQQIRRKQGKSVTGKLDVNGFEWLQQKYASEKISIRHSVGGTTRRAEQWLG